MGGDCRGCCLALLLIPVLCCVMGACAVIYVYTSSPEPPVASEFKASQPEADNFVLETSVSGIQSRGGAVIFSEREISSWVALHGEQFYADRGNSYPFKNVQVGLDNGVMSFYAEYNRYGLSVPLTVEIKPAISSEGRLSLDIKSASIADIHAPQFVLNRATSQLEDWLTEPFQELQQRVVLDPNTLLIEDGSFLYSRCTSLIFLPGRAVDVTILITGGAGFIGSHLAQALLERGETVVALDNFNDYYDPAIKRANAERLAVYPRFTMVEGDIRDMATVETVFTSYRVRRVAHLAAMAGVRESVKQTRLYVEVNTLGSMNLLDAAQQHNVEMFVQASTSSVYGETTRLPFVETDAADRPLASYPASKRAAELLCHTYHHLHGLNVTVLRFFNVYGPAGRPDMMPMRVMNAVLDGSTIPIFNGGDIHRDWTYIDDTVSGIIAALDQPLGYEVINLGVGAPIALREFIEVVEELSGRKLNTRNVPTPPSDPPITFCDNTKARQLLGFNPQTSVQDGLAKTWDWFRQWRIDSGTWPE